MATFTDWLARTFFISAEQEQTANAVQASQQAEANRQLASGALNTADYINVSRQIQNTGTTFFDSQLGRPGATGVTLNWWYIWLALAIVAFLYFGGLNMFKRK